MADTNVLLRFAAKAKQSVQQQQLHQMQQESAAKTPSPPPISTSATSEASLLLDLLCSLTFTYQTTMANLTSEQKLHRLGDFLEHDLCAPPAKRSWVEDGWTVVMDTPETGKWKFVTSEGVELARFAEVAQLLGLASHAIKLAELVDYLEFDRKLPISFKDWTCTPNLTKSKAQQPSVYLYQPDGGGKVKQFYRLNAIGDFVEKSLLLQFHRDRGNVLQPTSAALVKRSSRIEEEDEGEDEDDENEDDDSDDSRAALTAQSAAMVAKQKWIKRLKVGDPVLVEMKNKSVVNAIICPTAVGARAFDPVDREVYFSIYYVADGRQEDSVSSKRILSVRRETKEDTRAKQGALRMAPAPGTATSTANTRLKSNANNTAAKRSQVEENARLFLDACWRRIGKTLPGQYQLLSGMLNAKPQLLSDVRDLVLDLFQQDDADLVMQFSQLFLPPDAKITSQSLRAVQVERLREYALFKKQKIQ
ncbi:hypothetical protein BASA81_006153 [Batrachochytrium salamandrivorans]|nr:hypothetical protein BASA81_006153 [Batrachochytrium salamandrivorans]